MKKLIALLVVILLAGTGIYYWKYRNNEVDADTEQPKIVKVESGRLQFNVSSTGRVVSNLDVEIKCKASGEIEKLPYDVSDYVKKGELLVELDPLDEQRFVNQTEVELSSSKAQLIKAKQNLIVAQSELDTNRKKTEVMLKSAIAKAQDERSKADRIKHLLEKKLTSQEEHETAEMSAIQAEADLELVQVQIEELKTEEKALELKKQDVHLAEAQVELNQIELSSARQSLKDTKIYAPIDGIITARYVQIGQIISSGITNVGGGTSVMTLSDLSRIFVIASVDESDIGNVKVGQKVIITVDAFPQEVFSGEVVRIAPKGENVSNVVTFEVKIEVLDDKKSMLKPEMTANMEIIVAEKEEALIVPTEAIYIEEGKKIVLILNEDGTTSEREIAVGINNGVKTEVISGLKAGEEIVVLKGGSPSRWRSTEGVSASRVMFTTMGRKR